MPAATRIHRDGQPFPGWARRGADPALAGALPRAVPRGAMTQDHRINYLVVVGTAGGNVSSTAV